MTQSFATHTLAPPTAARPTAAPGESRIAVILRAEALFELALAIAAYRHFGGGWLMFAACFLLPDLSMAAYAVNRRLGSVSYNLAHTYVAPALLALVGLMLATPLLCTLALIWAAHIGFDRVMGYGLKHPAAFGATHLGGSKP